MATMFAEMTKRFNMLWAVIALVVSVKGFLVPIPAGPSDVVHTQYGIIRGTRSAVPFDNRNYQVRTFLGIPYAEPPIGDLRLRKPVPISSFTNNQFDAYSYGPSCPGRIDPGPNQTEDCLRLNIFSPTDMAGNELVNLPVMLWIHGGGFILGSGALYDGSLLSAYTGVIVVTINYRLGPLGFFSFENDDAPGNYGLWDQHLAIKWVHDHISNFGGDPDNITIFGESAGSSSVVYQMAYSGNKGLFKRAIAESGTINNWAVGKKGDSLRASKRFAEKVGCNSSFSDAEILSCIRLATTEEMTKAAQEEYFAIPDANFNYFIYPSWIPVFDNSFVPVETGSLLDAMTKTPDQFPMFSNTDLMIGLNNYDGFLYLEMYMNLLNSSNIEHPITADEYKHVCVPRLAEMYFKQPISSLTIQAILNEYTDWQDPNNDTSRLDNLAKLTTDATLTVPTVLTAGAHTGGTGSTFLYEFASSPPDRSQLIAVPAVLEGPEVANHGDEIVYILGSVAFVSNTTSSQLNLSKAMMKMWSNFAKTGNPNGPDSIGNYYQDVAWPAYTNVTQKYLRITPTMTSHSVNSYLAAKAVDLWQVVLPKIQNLENSKTCRVL